MFKPEKPIPYEVYVHAALKGMRWTQKTAWVLLQLPGLVSDVPSHCAHTHTFNRYAPSIIAKPKDVEALIEAIEILKQVPQETITQFISLFGDTWDKERGPKRGAKKTTEEPAATTEQEPADPNQLTPEQLTEFTQSEVPPTGD